MLSCATTIAPSLAKFALPPVWSPWKCVLMRYFTGSGEMNWLVMALRLQREVGGSLADVMQTTADTMRDRAYLRRQVRTLSAEGRMSAYVLMALPFFTTITLTRLMSASGIITFHARAMSWSNRKRGIVQRMSM